MSVLRAESNSRRWWITITVMLVAVLELLDTTIVTVSLPQMMGSLSVNVDQVTWVLTSYIVSAAIVMPLTGFLVNTFGSKKLLLMNIIGFMISSMLCGIAGNLIQMVFFRCCQGVFGAALVPLSQFILRDTFDKKELGMAMAIWGMGIMAAPILGPTLGGLITEHLSWRWVFYINLPICLLAYFMTIEFIQDSGKTQKQSIDLLGLVLMAIGVGCLQILLDRGNSVGWFDAASTQWLLVGTIVALSGFVWQSVTTANPIVDLGVFKDRNFCLSTILMMLFFMVVFGQIALSPLMFQTLLNYPALTAGFAMAPRGIASMIAMALVGRFIRYVDPRVIMTFGIFCALCGTYALAHLNLSMSYGNYLFGCVVQGLGMGFFIVPVATLSLSNLKPEDMPGAAGFFGLSRNLGQSIGISVMATILAHMSQANWHVLGGYVTLFNPHFIAWQHRVGMDFHNPVTMQILANQIHMQAEMIAFNDIAWFGALGLFIALPFIFMLQKPKAVNLLAEVH